MLLRRGENLLFVLVLPVLLLVFFSKVDVGLGPSTPGDLLPPILALAIMSSAFLGLSISTAFERKYLVLKRLGLSPLGPSGLIVGKLIAIGVVEIIQVVTLCLVSFFFLGWSFRGAILPAILFLVVGSAAFGSAGLFLAGNLRAEGTLAVTNGTYALLVLFGGVFVPLTRLPKSIGNVAGFLPSAALTNGLRAAMAGAAFSTRDLLSLLVFGALFSVLAVKTFRWE
jgi:ABC-2 type transport system permease protein